MFRIGNDIVDLLADGVANKHVAQKFVWRIFVQQEQSAIQQAAAPTTLLWALWAAKEAAYKACKKQFPDIFFSPRQFVITEDSLQRLLCAKDTVVIGKLQYQENMLQLQWRIESTYIHCIAILTDLTHNADFSQFVHKIDDALDMRFLKKYFTMRELQSIFSTASLQLRLYAKRLLRKLGITQKIEIIRNKTNGSLEPPQIIVDQKETMHEVSFSHDGVWVAGIIAVA